MTFVTVVGLRSDEPPRRGPDGDACSHLRARWSGAPSKGDCENRLEFAGGLCCLSGKGTDGASYALLQVCYGLSVCARVDCVLEKVQRALKDFYNVQRNLVWHDLSHHRAKFREQHPFGIDAAEARGGLLLGMWKGRGSLLRSYWRCECVFLIRLWRFDDSEDTGYECSSGRTRRRLR